MDPARFRGTVQAAVNRGITQSAAFLVQYIKVNMSRRGVTSTPGNPPAIQTGNLSRSISKTPTQNGTTFVHTSGVEYAPILEYGGTIKPVAKQYLTIPIGREGRRIRKEAKGSLENSPRDMFFYKSKRGNLLLMERHGKRNKATPRFVLKRSVYIRARPFMRPPLQNKMVRAEIIRHFLEASTRQFVALTK
jgi:phage gpG-like protein